MKKMPIPDAVNTGKNINRMRLEAGMSVRDMQVIFGFATPQAIYKWIKGKTIPAVDNLVILSAMFGVPIDEILSVEWK